jgi:phosphonate transport system permease protein
VGAVMPTIQNNSIEIWRRRTSKEQWIRWIFWLIGLSIIFFAWNTISEKTIWFFVQDAPNQAADIAARMVPPKWSYIDKLWKPVWDTINIATIGTVIAMIIAVPVAFATARNTTPNIVVRTIGLFIIVSSRSVNSLIWALILVFILGPGVLAGTIAIGLRSIGFCAKLIYESIEEIDHTQVEAIEATGASGPQKMIYGILPQVLPTIAGVGIYRWDINIRESTILGLVGAGGIGLQLNGSLNTLAWTQVSLILLVILVTVFISEWVSAKVRGAII